MTLHTVLEIELSKRICKTQLLQHNFNIIKLSLNGLFCQYGSASFVTVSQSVIRNSFESVVPKSWSIQFNSARVFGFKIKIFILLSRLPSDVRGKTEQSQNQCVSQIDKNLTMASRSKCFDSLFSPKSMFFFTFKSFQRKSNHGILVKIQFYESITFSMSRRNLVLGLFDQMNQIPNHSEQQRTTMNNSNEQ